MKKSLWLVLILLVVVTLLAVGCSRHPEGMKSLRWLTDAEKDEVIEIALNTREAKKAKQEYGVYQASLSWLAVRWGGSDYEGYWGLDYEWVDEEILPPPPDDMPPDIVFTPIPESAEFYSRVILRFGEPPQWQVSVAVNPDTGKVALVEENPSRTGPTPPE